MKTFSGISVIVIFGFFLLIRLSSCTDKKESSEPDKNIQFKTSIEKHCVERVRYIPRSYHYKPVIVILDSKRQVHKYSGYELSNDLALAEKGDSLYVYKTLFSEGYRVDSIKVVY